MRQKNSTGIHTDQETAIPLSKERKSIASRLSRHSLLVCFLTILVCGILLLTVLLFFHIYNGVIDSSYYLEEFSEQVNQIQDLAVKQSSGVDDESRISMILECDSTAQKDIRKLNSVAMPGNYRRNMEDMQTLYASFMDNVQSMLESKETVTGSDKSLLETSDVVTGSDTETPMVNTEPYMVSYNSMKELVTSISHRCQILYTELSLYHSERRNVLRRDMHMLILSVVGTVILTVLVMRRLSSALSCDITVPLKVLTERAEKVQHGNFENNAAIAAGTENAEAGSGQTGDSITAVPSEITTLNETFDVMLAKIREQFLALKESMRLKDQLKEQELENLRVVNLLSTSQLQCLQMQINPHFLFNTMNMIQQTVYLGQPEKTSYLLKQTAAFLRYSLDYSGRSVSLQQELEALGNYVSLQEERLGERILFEFDLDETIDALKVPALILQPLVENSLIHGLCGRTEGGVISIITKYDDEQELALISVADNGHGFGGKKLADIRSQLKANDKMPDKSIGLVNIEKRIRLMYPDGADLQVESVPEERTAVCLKIPYSRECRKI